MFSKSLCATLLALSLSAFTAQAAPTNRFGFGNGRFGNNQESCNTVSVVTQTVTVTAAAAGATSNNSGSGGAAGNNAQPGNNNGQNNNNGQQNNGQNNGNNGQQNNGQQNNGNNGQQNNNGQTGNNGQQNNGQNNNNNNGQQNNGNNGQNNNGQQNNGNNGQNGGNNGQNGGNNGQNNGQNNGNNGQQNGNNGQQNNGNNGQNNGQNNNNGQQNNGQQNNGGNNGNNGQNNGGNNVDGDPQTSLTLDPKVIATGFANNGQSVPADGQVASLTSTNNFINFCLTAPNTPITNGKQITTGSCNPAPIGLIPSVDNMPSSKFVFPQNFGNVQANQAFTIRMAIKNLVTGNFVNAQENYFAAPQQLNGNGQIIGHSHVVVEQLASIDQQTPTDPKKFAFFKGLNAAAQNGELTADVANGLPDGAYRLCSINAAANHQPAIVPIAQHGALDDCVYFTAGNAGNNGGNNNGNNGNNNNNGGNNNGNNGQNNGGNNAGNAGNLQPFTEAVGGFAAPAVTAGGRGFQVQGSDDFTNIGAALGRSCDIQKNQCADAANAGAGHTVQQCEDQRARCGQAIQNVNAGGNNFLSSLPPVESATASASSAAESASVTASASSVAESASVTASASASESVVASASASESVVASASASESVVASASASESAAPTKSASVEASATVSASSEAATATSKVAEVTSSAAAEATSSAAEATSSAASEEATSSAVEEATSTSEAASAETSAPAEEKAKGKKGKGQQEESQN